MTSHSKDVLAIGQEADEVTRVAAHIFESVHHGMPITDESVSDATRAAYLAMAHMAIQLLDGMRAQRKASAVSEPVNPDARKASGEQP